MSVVTVFSGIVSVAKIPSQSSRPSRKGKDRLKTVQMEYGFSVLCRRNSPQWVLEGDIKGCFDNISHRWLEENIPMDAKVLREFMKCGYVYNRILYPTINGTPQGGY